MGGRDGWSRCLWAFGAAFGLAIAGGPGCSGSDPGTDGDTVSGDDDDDDDAAAVCFAEPGTWTLHYEGDADNDPFCPDIPDSQSDEVGGTVTTDPTCDQGCTCTEDVFAPPSCDGGFHQTCSQGDVETTTDCTFHLVSSTAVEGRCEVTLASPQVDLTCGYTYTGAHD